MKKARETGVDQVRDEVAKRPEERFRMDRRQQYQDGLGESDRVPGNTGRIFVLAMKRLRDQSGTEIQ